MMSKKDYELVASLIREHGDVSQPGWYRFASQLAHHFKRNNPKFDTDRFYQACFPIMNTTPPKE